MQPTNVIFFTRLYFPHKGGVEKHVAKLIDTFPNPCQLTIVTEQYDKKLKIRDKYDGVTIIRIPYRLLNSKLKLWKYIYCLRYEIQRSDIIHIHDVFWWYIPLLIFRKRYYITFHGYRGNVSPKLNEIIQRFIADRLAIASICVGSFMKRWYFAKPKIISYGAGDITPHNRKPIYSFGYFGRFEVDTGLFTYLKTLSYLEGKYTAHFFGEGSLAIKRRIKTLRKNINTLHFGWIDDISIKIADYRYIFASQYLSILEAMQAKRLVLAVYNNEIKKDYLMCHPMAKNMIIAGSAKELADKFNSLTEAQEHIMIEKAYAWAKDQTWEKLANQYLDLWGITQ
jgi:hypothetical protein